MPKIRGFRPPRPFSNKSTPLPRARLSRKHGMRNYTIECDGGPLNGEHLKVRYPSGTLPIVLRGQAGYYSGGGTWMACQAPGEYCAARAS